MPLFSLIAFEYRARGPRPDYVSTPALLGQFLMWPLMGVITFFWASLPALHAQWKLASGRGLVYRVAEKGGPRFHSAPLSLDEDRVDLDRPKVGPPEHQTVESMNALAGDLKVL